MTAKAAAISPFDGMTERQILDDHDKVCGSLNAFSRLCLRKIGLTEVTAPKTPKWFVKCFESYWKSSWGKIPIDLTEEKITIREAGYFRGYFSWYLKWAESLDASLANLSFPYPQLSDSAEQHIAETWEKALIPDEVKADFDSFESGEASKLFDGIDEVLEKLPASEESKFYEGWSKGALGPTGLDDASLGETTATKIYFFLILFSPWIGEYPSAAFLHQKLVLFFGKNAAGTLKRTEKLCQRIGLKFRGPGRPQKIWPFTPRKKRRRSRS